MKRFLVLAAPLALAPSLAFAHATLEKQEAVKGAAYKAVMRVGHGCDGEATLKLRVRIPEGVIAVKPMPKPGWTLELVKGPYKGEYDYYGDKLKEGVVEIIWTGELSDEHYDEFVFRGFLTDGLKEGETIYFPTVQECAKGSARWVEIPAEGQDPHDLKASAPGVKIIAPAASAHEGHKAAQTAAPSAPAAHAGHGPMSTGDSAEIEALLKSQFERPDAPLTVAPVTVRADAAVAGWSQDGKGGRAFLKRDDKGWFVQMCAGAGHLSPSTFVSMGLSAADAKDLAESATKAEAALGDEAIKRFDAFEGVVTIGREGMGGHDAGHGHAR